MIFLKLFSKTMKEPFNLGILMVMISGLLGKFIFLSYLFLVSWVGSNHCFCAMYSYGSGQWTADMRSAYNLDDSLTRHTAQVT